MARYHMVIWAIVEKGGKDWIICTTYCIYTLQHGSDIGICLEKKKKKRKKLAKYVYKEWKEK